MCYFTHTHTHAHISSFVGTSVDNMHYQGLHPNHNYPNQLPNPDANLNHVIIYGICAIFARMDLPIQTDLSGPYLQCRRSLINVRTHTHTHLYKCERPSVGTINDLNLAQGAPSSDGTQWNKPGCGAAS